MPCRRYHVWIDVSERCECTAAVRRLKWIVEAILWIVMVIAMVVSAISTISMIPEIVVYPSELPIC